MPDVAIVNTTIAAEPKDYRLAGGQELLVKAVRAVVDGTSATGAFLPVLQLLAPDGTVMWEGFPPSAVAAGASADVSWFPGAALTAAQAATLPTVETLFLNTVTGSVTTSFAFRSGVTYLVGVQGTVSKWNEVLDIGTPQPDALYPTTNGNPRVSLETGLDAECLFACPSDHIHPITHDGSFKIDTGAGAAHIEPFGGPYSTPQPDFFYTFNVTGAGSAVTFSWQDSPNADNYGSFKIDVYGIPGSGGGTVTSVTAADTSIVIGGTAAAPTVRTNTLDVIAADHPPAANWSNNSHKITSVTDPTSAQDAATKAYVDSQVASPLTTKGDLYGFSTLNARIPVGSDNQILVADSAQSLGVKWAAAGGGGPGLAKSQIGYTSVGGTTVTATNRQVIAKQITPGASGTVIGIALYMKWQADMVVYFNAMVAADSGSNTIGNVIAFNSAGSHPGVAATTAGAGGADLHQSSEVARWVTIPITCELAAATPYWVGFSLAPDSVVGGTMPLIYYDGSGTDRRYTPSPFTVLDGATAGDGTDSRKHSLYAIYLS